MKTFRQIPKSIRGFTLVETLVSVTLFLMIMTMVGTMFNQFLSSTKRMASVMSTYDGVRVFATQITKELSRVMVRVNDNRWLNLKVEEIENDEETAGTRVFFTAPDDSLRSVRTLNFISHYAYFWKKEDQALYRAVYNTRVDPEPLAQTASHPDNSNRTANQNRLANMTLAYRSGTPYGWTESDEMKELMDQEPYDAILRNVFDFKVHCYDKPKSQNPNVEGTWNDPQKLPLFVELEIFVSNSQAAASLRKELESTGELSEESRKKLRRFLITVPIRNHGINDSNLY